MIANNTVDDRLLALPWFTTVAVLYYRADLLDRHGEAVPRTWDELTTAAARVQQAERREGNDGLWGYVWQGRAYQGLTCNALEWVVSEGGGPIVACDGPAGALVSLAGGARLRVDADASAIAPGAGVTCAIRPKRLQLSPPADALPAGSVVLVERLGDHSLVLVRLDRLDRSEDVVMARIAPGAEPATGTAVGLGLRSAHCHLFDGGDRACPRRQPGRPG
jgi:hypothetical protein